MRAEPIWFSVLINLIGVALNRQFRIRKYLPGLCFKMFQGAVFGTEMTDKEFTYHGLLRQLRSLFRGGMKTLKGFFPHVIQIGRFMIDHVGAIDMMDQSFVIFCIGTEGVLMPSLGSGCHLVIRDPLTPGGNIIQALL